jgi:hypothetical protein
MPDLPHPVVSARRADHSWFCRRLLRLTVILVAAQCALALQPWAAQACEEAAPSACDDATIPPTDPVNSGAANPASPEEPGKDAAGLPARSHSISPSTSGEQPQAESHATSAGADSEAVESGTGSLPFLPLFFLPLSRAQGIY